MKNHSLILIFVACSLMSFVSKAMENERSHKENIANNGYSIFNAENCPLNLDKINKITEIFRNKSISRGLPRKHAYYLAISCDAVTDLNGVHLVNSSTPFDSQSDLIFTAEHLIFPVLELFPKGNINTKRFISIVFVDDFRARLEDNEEMIRNGSSPLIREYHSDALFWHQDTFKEQDYRYLFFIVTDLSGVSPHSLELGTTEEGSCYFEETFALKTKEEAKVKLLESFPSKRGSGYGVDQKRPIVHRHTDFSSYISNFDITEENVSSIFPAYYKNLLNASNNNVHHSEYKTPRRYKFIVRIGEEEKL